MTVTDLKRIFGNDKEEYAMNIDVSKIRAGDWVSITVGYEDQPESHATLSGTVYTYEDTLRVGTDCLRNTCGEPGLTIRSIDEHKPARRVGDLKISPDGLPAVYIGKGYFMDTATWAMPGSMKGQVAYLTNSEVAHWADAEAVEK